MSLDAHWFSTIFGVYFFASCVLCVHATLSAVADVAAEQGAADEERDRSSTITTSAR